MTPAVLSGAPGLVLAGGFTDLNLGLTIWTVVLFGLFAFVLSKYAWKPLLEVIEVRERMVREHVDKAEKAQAEAQSPGAAAEGALPEGGTGPRGDARQGRSRG